MMRWRIRPSSARVPTWALLLGGLAIMAACEGRTILEGELLEAPPALLIDRSVTPAQVHAGTGIRIRVRAEGRTSGVASIRVAWTGALEGSFTRAYPDGPMAVVLDTTIASRHGVEGNVVFTAIATSTAGVESEPLDIIVGILGPDTDPPEVSVASAIPDRVEAHDSLEVTVRCRDLGEAGPAGRAGQLAWCGYTVLFFQPGGDTVTVTRRDTVPARDTAAIRDVIPVQGFSTATLPTDLNIAVHGFAIDAAGNCSAGVLEAWSRESCVGTAGILADVDDEPIDVTVVASTTINRHWGGTLEELAVDEARGLVYGSVIDRNRIEVLNYVGPREQARQADILVGSRPAGIVMDRTGDSLIVANSGGTSLSFVDLNARTERPRMETHNAALYTITRDVDRPNIAALTLWEEFGDRPHRVAQDRDGVIFYSTLGGGPIRMVQTHPNATRREANIMLWSDVLVEAPGDWAVTYVDSMVIKPEGIEEGGFILQVWDHVPGRPNDVIMAQGTVDQIEQIFTSLQAQGSDVFFREDKAWDMDYWHVGGNAMFNTSRDRSTIAIADESRAWTWIASGSNPGFNNRLISWYLSIDDLSSNLRLGIEGVSVDGTGRQFAVRGGNAVVYFDNLLRVHGSHEFDVLSGPAGVALHPVDRLAFAPTNDRSVLVLETGSHYQQRAEMPLVENLVGPVHFSPRRAGDPETLIGRIHGVNESGNVVTLPVRQADLQ